jgi:hypothetical protein
MEWVTISGQVVKSACCKDVWKFFVNISIPSKFNPLQRLQRNTVSVFVPAEDEGIEGWKILCVFNNVLLTYTFCFRIVCLFYLKIFVESTIYSLQFFFWHLILLWRELGFHEKLPYITLCLWVIRIRFTSTRFATVVQKKLSRSCGFWLINDFWTSCIIYYSENHVSKTGLDFCVSWKFQCLPVFKMPDRSQSSYFVGSTLRDLCRTSQQKNAWVIEWHA